MGHQAAKRLSLFQYDINKVQSLYELFWDTGEHYCWTDYYKDTFKYMDSRVENKKKNCNF